MPAQSRVPVAAPAKPAAELAPAGPAPAVENSVAAAALASSPPAEEGSALLAEDVSRPFEKGASRGDLVWAIARELGGMRQSSREDAIAWAESEGLLHGRSEDPASRAETAVILARFLALPLELPEGQIAYFADVDESAWYFDEVHAARRFGLFVGSNNEFHGDSSITPDNARTVLERAKAPALRTPEQQCPGQKPMLKPDALSPLLAKDELGADEIAKAREKIAAKPEEERPALYRELARKVSYRNQRDNSGKYALKDARRIGAKRGGDVMCNVTSMAMGLNQLGIGADESHKQLEDQLDEKMVEGHLGSRYDFGGQSHVAAKMGAKAERVATPSFRNGAEAQAFYEKKVLPRLEQGAAATLSIAFGRHRNEFHIVRLEWVEGEGLTIDDPYGKLYRGKGYYTYEKNDVASSKGDGAKGEDSLWSWETVASVNRGRYVQFLTKA